MTLAHWGDQLCCGYSLVRVSYLHLDDRNKIIIVARIPLQRVDGWDPEPSNTISSQIASEVATMEYIEAHTNISVPHIIHYSVEFKDLGVRSPYMLMSKVNGVPLSSLWNTMEDQLRDVVLRQVVDIKLKLASQRFDMIGVLLRRDGSDKNMWYIEPMAGESNNGSIGHRAVSTTTHINAIEYRTDFMNSHLRDLSDNNCGITAFHREGIHLLAGMVYVLTCSLPLRHIAQCHRFSTFSRGLSLAEHYGRKCRVQSTGPCGYRLGIVRHSRYIHFRAVSSLHCRSPSVGVTTPCVQGASKTSLHLINSFMKRTELKRNQMVVNPFHVHLQIASAFTYS